MRNAEPMRPCVLYGVAMNNKIITTEHDLAEAISAELKAFFTPSSSIFPQLLEVEVRYIIGGVLSRLQALLDSEDEHGNS